LDLTTGVFPVTKVDLQKDVVPADWKPLSELDQQLMDFCEYCCTQNRVKKVLIQADGKPERHENALIGLTVIARRLEEEKVTAMLGVLSEVVGVDY
jgi:amidase